MNFERARLATMAAFFINGAAIATWAANIPSVREHLELSETTLGFTLLTIAVGSVLALLVAGQLSARFGSRTLTIASTILLIPLVPMLIVAPSLPLLVLTLFAYGISVSLMDVVMNAHGVLVEQRLDRPIMSSLHALWSAGALVGAGAGSLLLGAGVSPITFALLSAGVLAVIALLSLPFLLPSALDRGNKNDAPAFVFPTGKLLGVALLVLLAYVAEGAIADWSGVYLRDGLRTDRGLAVGGYVAFSLTMFGARLVGDRLRARFNAVVLLRGSGILAATGMALALIAPFPTLAIVGFGLTGLGLANVVPVLFTAAGNTPGVPAATAVAAAAGAGYAGFLAGPPLVGVLAGVFSLRWALVLVVVFALLIAIFSNVFKQNRVADVAPTS